VQQAVDSAPMFSSPIVFAGWRHIMDGLGFTLASNTSIQQILDAVESGKSRVWITNPTQSNSGATVYFGFLNYSAGNPPGKAVTQDQLDSPQVRDGITRFSGQVRPHAAIYEDADGRLRGIAGSV
jgi:Ca-activated chloride channel homolog